MPPEPVITRWGTWIQAALYYASNLDAFSDVIEQLPSEDAASIVHVKEVLKSPALAPRLRYISAHYSTLPLLLEHLEKRDVSLRSAIERVLNFKMTLDDATGVIGQRVAQKFNSVLERNPRWRLLCEISTLIDDPDGIYIYIPVGIFLLFFIVFY